MPSGQKPPLSDGADTRHLEWHGRQWRVVVAVPRDLRAVLGASHVRTPLHTADLRMANRLKPIAVARLKAGIAKARRQLNNEPDDAVERFIIDCAYQPKSAGDARRSIRRLMEYATATGLRAEVAAINRATARGFLRDLLHRRALDRHNVAKHLGFIRSYWRWLEDEDLIPLDSSPWEGLCVPRPPAVPRHADLEDDKGKRAYTDDEMRKLLYGTTDRADAFPRELLTLAPLSGMRIEELYRIRVRDITADGFFDLKTGKTKNAIRRVPIHSAAKKLVEKLRKGKAESDYLIDPEAPVVALTGIRSSAASKAFTRYRRALGVDERPNGKAKSNIDFHSFRRWFMKKAKEALDAGAKGFTAWTIADVVGHDDEGIAEVLKLTMSHYPGRSGDAALRACVEAVKLPKDE